MAATTRALGQGIDAVPTKEHFLEALGILFGLCVPFTLGYLKSGTSR